MYNFQVERLAGLRRQPRVARWALALWIAWAVILWNVVFDHQLAVAGRRYVHAATVAAEQGTSYARVDDWMRPAVARGLWIASSSAGAVLLAGLLGVRVATTSSARGQKRRATSGA
jgi:hypothetical protein